ncbi:hypothetical protein ACJRO7_026745 [Eucalyptus globulus]|uniref:S-protein homolog n=1 Tax=Eucalyptus globulus TaxID=34317 RepID=A0ABD3JNU7_EUCGL
MMLKLDHRYPIMVKSSAKLIFICSLLLASCVRDVWGKIHVVIHNNLPAGTTLTVHCKSKDDDLGFHYITSSWEFSFNINFLRTTLFFCSFAWPNHFERFDIYVTKRDDRHCSNLCEWNISPTGPCRKNENTGAFDVCFPWNPPTQLGRKTAHLNV